VSTPASEPPRKNGVTATLAALGNQLVAVLPPAFVLLIILNVIFLGVVTYVFDRHAVARNELLTKIVERCLLTQQRQ
jgi:hypothetical protein